MPGHDDAFAPANDPLYGGGKSLLQLEKSLARLTRQMETLATKVSGPPAAPKPPKRFRARRSAPDAPTGDGDLWQQLCQKIDSVRADGKAFSDKQVVQAFNALVQSSTRVPLQQPKPNRARPSALQRSREASLARSRDASPNVPRSTRSRAASSPPPPLLTVRSPGASRRLPVR